MTHTETLGERIRRDRLAHDMTQETLAAELGTSRFRVIKWEADREIPGGRYAEKLRRLFGIPGEMFEREAATAALRAQVEEMTPRLEELEGRVATAEGERRDLVQLVAELTDRVEHLEARVSTAQGTG